MRDLDTVFQRLSKSPFRSRFRLDSKDRAYLVQRGTELIREHARDFISKRLSDAEPLNDGKQTPWRGHPVFVAQQRLAGRKAPNNAVVRAALKALDGQQDGLSRRMLGQVLGLAELQVRGLLAGLQRLLNVDGYQVIVVDEASGIVELNRRLLDKQFQLLQK